MSEPVEELEVQVLVELEDQSRSLILYRDTESNGTNDGLVTLVAIERRPGP